MKIICNHIEDFIENLRDAEVFRNVVYHERSDRPLNGKSKLDATSFQIIYQTSAILEFEDGQALLACGLDCGIDRNTGDGGLDGSSARGAACDMLKRFCEEKGLRLLPGVLDQ